LEQSTTKVKKKKSEEWTTMKMNIDFSLSGRFDVVEQTIFRLIIGGVKDVKTIGALLSIYSDEVIANAIRKLVNYQILSANIEARTLSVSEVLLALMEKCIQQSGQLELSIETGIPSDQNKVFITDEVCKRQILNALLPEINTGFLAKSLDFVIYEEGGQNE
jgi:hypothetical protein